MRNSKYMSSVFDVDALREYVTDSFSKTSHGLYVCRWRPMLSFQGRFQDSKANILLFPKAV